MDIAVVILNWNGEQMLRRYLPGVVSSVEGFSARLRGSGICPFGPEKGLSVAKILLYLRSKN